MMTPTLESIARQLAASPRWKWLPGMLTTAGLRVEYTDDKGRAYAVSVHSPTGFVATVDVTDAIPDLSDPLTAAGLVALAREVAGPTLYTYPTGNGWNAIRSGEVLAWCETEIEALAAVILGGAA